MMLEFGKYLKENFNEDVSIAESIIKEKWDKVVAIIKEAFDDEYADKRTALHRIRNEFVDKNVAPKTIDIDFLKENMDYVVNKVNSLDEGEIRITINNDVDKSKSAGLGMESTGKKRGRPRKNVVEEETEETEEEKRIVVDIEGKKVTVNPIGDDTGLEKSENEFDTEEEAKKFAESLKGLFANFTVEIQEDREDYDEEQGDVPGEQDTGPNEYKESNSLKESENDNNDRLKEVMSKVSDGEELTDEDKEVISVAVDAAKEGSDGSMDTLGKIMAKISDGEELTDEDKELLSVALKVDDEEEMEDAEETEDAEEMEDAINWDDVADLGGEDEEAEEEMGYGKSYDLNSVDLTKLVDKLVRVDEDWYRVTSISEDSEVVCVNKKGSKSKFFIEQIDEMEYEEEMGAEEECGDAEECMMAPSEEEMTEPRVGQEVLYRGRPCLIDAIEGDIAYLSDEDGAEYEASVGELEVIGRGNSEEEMEEPEGGAEESEGLGAEEEVEETQEEGLSFAKLANRYMDGDPIEEDALTPPSMVDTAKGLTSHPSKPGEKVEKVPAAPKAPTKTGPSASLTAKPGKPPKKTEKVPSPPKSVKKATPTGSYTKKPGKPKQKIDNVKAPDIPQEYKRGGSKG